MKSSNPIVTVIVIGAVLVAAYAVGLLIRQARVGDSSSSPAPAADVNESLALAEKAEQAHKPGGGRKKDTQQARAELKEEHAQALEKMESATDQEKAAVREQIREQVSAKPAQRGSRRSLARPKGVANAPGPQDPNALQQQEKTDSEPNRGGES